MPKHELLIDLDILRACDTNEELAATVAEMLINMEASDSDTLGTIKALTALAEPGDYLIISVAKASTAATATDEGCPVCGICNFRDRNRAK